jgi:putative transposase
MIRKQSSNPSELTIVDVARWDEARRRLPIVRRLAEDPKRSRADARAAADELGIGVSHFYVLLKRYLSDPRLTSLVPKPSGGVRGRSRLSTGLESLIDEAIETFYLTSQRPSVTALLLETRRRCNEVGAIPPSRKAITVRLRAKPGFESLRRREGRKAARDRFAPVTNSLESPQPLALVQMDHTLVDVIVVDSETRAPIQRPWLTLAIDVYSRCVLGFYLSLEPPSATSVALCIAHAVFPKKYWLIERDVAIDWPMHGLMRRLHLDNAKEFRSEALRRGCEQYGIAIDYRPVRTPHYGGHIERLIGTMMGKVHLLPGTTFSSIQAKGENDPEKDASMTVHELERWLSLAIAGEYHCTPHRSLGTTPLGAWQQAQPGQTEAPLDPMADARRFLIDFLPLERRLVRRDGIALNSIHYWADILRSWIGKNDPMIVRYDPRDLSRIYLYAPDGNYYDIPYRDLGRPPISLWEQRRAIRSLREKGLSQFDEKAIFRTVEQMRAIVAEAVSERKAARRDRERRLEVIRGGRTADTKVGSKADLSLVWNEEEDTRQPWEDMLPVEEWK